MVSVLRALAFAACLAAPIAASAQPAGQEVRFEALPPQQLDPGVCGLFLWSRTERPALVLVARDNPAEAKVRVDGRTRDLRRAAFSGDPNSGHFQRQTFSDGRLTLDLEITFDASRPVRDGAIISGGVLRTRDEAGWETMQPVGGLVACKTQP
jgi:hypothetical protein